MKITVRDRQNLWDLCLQYTGSLEGVFDLALANGLSLTDSLEAGQQLELPDGLETDPDIRTYFQDNDIVPATALTREQACYSHLGIGEMYIGANFKLR